MSAERLIEMYRRALYEVDPKKRIERISDLGNEAYCQHILKGGAPINFTEPKSSNLDSKLDAVSTISTLLLRRYRGVKDDKHALSEVAISASRWLRMEVEEYNRIA